MSRQATSASDRPRGEPSPQDSGAVAGQDSLAIALSDFARKVQKRASLAGTLEEIVRAALDLVPGCDEGSISAVQGRRHVTSQAPSSDLPKTVDELQDRLGQGPCLDAVYEQETVRVPDMATETRWPLFTQAASEAGAAGMLAVQLYVDGDNLGALNLFSRRANAFDDQSEHVALLLASHAALAYAAAQQHENMNRQVASRQLIGQAQGILMHRDQLTAEQAFACLREVSQRLNVKLVTVADLLVREGRLPTA